MNGVSVIGAAFLGQIHLGDDTYVAQGPSTLNISVSDTLSLGQSGVSLLFPEGFSAVFAGFRDFVSLRDSFSLALNNSFGISDTLSLIDFVTLNLDPIANLGPSDSVSLSDTATIQLIVVPQPISINISDNLNLADALDLTDIGAGIFITDILSINDNTCVVLQSVLRNYIRRYLNDVV